MSRCALHPFMTHALRLGTRWLRCRGLWQERANGRGREEGGSREGEKETERERVSSLKRKIIKITCAVSPLSLD